jgi:hypothetical protein
MIERLTVKDAKTLFAELYQICGTLGCNAKTLDNISAASRGLRPPHKTLLPFVDRERVPSGKRVQQIIKNLGTLRMGIFKDVDTVNKLIDETIHLVRLESPMITKKFIVSYNYYNSADDNGFGCCELQIKIIGMMQLIDYLKKQYKFKQVTIIGIYRL